jgi:hypothetical protein
MSGVYMQNGQEFENRRQTKEAWHLDKKVPISLIVFFIFQTAGFIWWASEINSTVKEHDHRLIMAEAFENRMDGDGRTVTDRLARLEEKSTSTLSSLQHIENLLERQEDRQRK